MQKIFIGYDSREAICYDVCKFSIQHNSTINYDINSISLCDIQDIYKRPADPLAATEFAYSRFLVPYLCNYRGWALFCDCDFIFLDDIDNLFSNAENSKAVMVCKHDYKPSAELKMDGKIQSQYPRKNWSSLMLWNCGHPANRILTPEVINTQTGKFLHRFEWLDDDNIGDLSIEWNWLVGWYKEPRDGKPRGLHYTEGGPWFAECIDCEYSDVWKKYSELYSNR